MMYKPLFVILLLVLTFAPKDGYSSHFRGAVIMVRPRPGGAEYEMEISYHISWRGSCDSNDIASGTLLSSRSNLGCQYGCSDTTISQMPFVCTCFNTEDYWLFGEHHITHIFNNTSDQNTVTIGTVNGNWISDVGDGSWNVSTTFSLIARNDTGIVNSSPRISSSLPLRLQERCSYTIPLVISDPDNDIIQCRWATEPECGGVCNMFPGATLSSSSCTISYTANDGVGYRVATVMIEDFARESQTGPLSSVALQFLVLIVSSSQPCSTNTQYYRFPSITSHPSDITVFWNESLNVTLSCMADEALYYYWEKYNGDIPTGAVGVHNDTLILINVQPEDTGSYRCVAFNCGTDSRRYSNYAMVTINVVIPVFVSHPSSKYIYPTQTATFTCNASGYNISYQWRIGSGSFPNKVMGIQSNTLVIPDVRSSDENTYMCIASNEAGSVSSRTANLTLTGVTVTIISSPAGIPVSGYANTFDYPILSSVTLTCHVIPHHGLPFTVNSYQWNTTGCYTSTLYNDGVPRCFPHGQVSQNLTDYYLTAEDSGTVACIVTISDSSYTVTSGLFTLRISGIGITGTLLGSELFADYSYINDAGDVDGSVTLAHCVTGLGPNNLDDNNALGAFYFNGNRIPNGECSDVVIQPNGAAIENYVGVISLFQCGTFSTAGEGVYTCTILNSSMANQSLRLGIYFHGRTTPVIDTPSPSNITIGVGSTVTLACISRGSPPDVFTWRKDDGPVVESTSITAVTHTSTSAVFNANYSIDNITTSDSGMYTCTVTNPIGSDSANFSVTVVACPQGMMYEQCGYFATCSYLNVSTSSIGCQRGCFCEDSTIHYNGSCAEIDICDCEIGTSDLVFILDTSENIGFANFQLIKGFLYNLTTLLNIGPTRSQIAVILYSSNTSLYFNLNDHRNKDSLLRSINDISYYSSSEESNVATALDLLYSSYMDGSLRTRDDHEHIAILFTDGLPDDFTATRRAANALHSNSDFQIYIIETNGTAPVSTEYEEIALDRSNVFSAPDFNEHALQQTMERIIQDFDTNLARLCNVLTVSSGIAVYPGETATFYCNASSDEIFTTTYQWERVELNGDKTIILSDDDIDGSGSAFDYSYILTVNNVNFTDNGVGFYCTAVNFSDSEVAYLNVLMPSIIAIFPMTSLSLQAFGSTTITCEAQGGPRLIITWYRTNQLVLSGQIGNTSLSYDIPSANVIDNGDYTCVASIDDYEVNSTSINILVSPVILVELVNTTAIEGDNVTFKCQTTYSVDTTVTWQYNGSDIDVSNISKYRVMETVISENIYESSLAVMSVTLSDVGVYTCLSENEAGNDTSNGGLRVQVPPTFSLGSDRVVTYVVSNVTLTCIALGVPAPNITWFNNVNDKVTDNKRMSINVTHYVDTTGLVRVTSILEILKSQNEDGGLYHCTADNGVSVPVDKTILLLVLEPLSVLNFYGYQVEPGAIINSFVSSFESSGISSGSGTDFVTYQELTLTCSTQNSNDRVKWMVVSFSNNKSFTVDQITVNNSLSNLTVRISEGELTVACNSEERNESISITITTENPYVRLLSESNVSATLGSRPILEYVIAIDSDGSELQQSSVINMITFFLNNSVNETVLQLTESREEFQHYLYILPSLDNSSTGEYMLTANNMTLGNVTITLNDKVPNPEISPDIGPTLEGQPISLNCSTSEDDVVVRWLFNGKEIALDDERYVFSPLGLNTMLTIINPNTSDSGVYSCEIDLPEGSRTEIGPSEVNVTFLLACGSNYSNGLLWDATERGVTSSITCSRIHSNFRDAVELTRSCGKDGSWDNTSTLDCTMHIDSLSVILVSATTIDLYNLSYYDQVTDDITQIAMKAVENNWMNKKSEKLTFTTFGISYVTIRMSFEMEPQLSENITSNITAAVNLSSDFTLEVIGFQPSYSCSCDPSKNEDGQISTICIGANIPPCKCFNEPPCQCNIPNFEGNGVFCGINSDGDRFPDRNLSCNDLSCREDRCPDMFSNSSNDGCPPPSNPNNACPEDEDVWGITWPPTNPTETAVQKCPGGVESLGFARRHCISDRTWDDYINVSECQSVEVVNILDDVEELDSNATSSQLTEITDRLSDFLSSSATPVLPGDLQNTNEILNIVLSLPSGATGNVSKDVIGVLDMVLDEKNIDSFEAAEGNASSEYLGTTERAAIVLASASSNQSLVVPGNNLFMEVQLPSRKNNIQFPSSESDFDDVRLLIPNSTIEGNDTVVNFIATTLGPLLQPQTSSMLTVQSSVVSSQILNGPQGKEIEITLEFEIRENNISNPVAGCYFWDFAESKWSNNGIKVSEASDTFIKCTSSHLTSFAVLVAPGGEIEDSTPLSVVSYIGCSVSIVCLLLTLCALFLWRNSIFNQIQHYIHFNLSLTLLVGLIVFVSGIETAIDSDVGCLIVALLLHYFFLAAFCWMLSEGILIFILLYFVFYKGFFKGWKFFTLLSWGLPIPVVVVSVAVSNEQYGTDRACWISDENGVIWAFIAPMLLIIMINAFFIVMTLRRVFLSKRNQLTADKASNLDVAKSLAKAACVLLPLLGITWVFGIFAINEEAVAFAWIFTILNSFQGLFIFILHVLRNEKFRERINAMKTGHFSKLFTSTSRDYTLKTTTLPKDQTSHEATDYYRSSTFTAKTLKEYNKVIRNEYVISSTNLEPEYYQKHKQSVPNPFNMANTVDDYDFDEEDTITSRKRMSTTVNLTPSDYLNQHRQAIFSNASRHDDDDEEDTTSL